MRGVAPESSPERGGGLRVARWRGCLGLSASPSTTGFAGGPPPRTGEEF